MILTDKKHANLRYVYTYYKNKAVYVGKYHYNTYQGNSTFTGTPWFAYSAARKGMIQTSGETTTGYTESLLQMKSRKLKTIYNAWIKSSVKGASYKIGVNAKKASMKQYVSYRDKYIEAKVKQKAMIRNTMVNRKKLFPDGTDLSRRSEV